MTLNKKYPNLGITVRKVLSRKDRTDNMTFGVRKYMDKNDFKKRGEFEFINYKEINDKVTHIASGLRYLGLKKGDKIGISGNNRPEWCLTDYACSVQSFVSVPLYSTLDKNAIQYIINHADIKCVVCSYDVLKEVNKCRQYCKKLKYIILMDYQLPAQIYASNKDNNGSYTYKLSEIENIGKSNIFPDVYPDSQDIWTIMYTSGYVIYLHE